MITRRGFLTLLAGAVPFFKVKNHLQNLIQRRLTYKGVPLVFDNEDTFTRYGHVCNKMCNDLYCWFAYIPEDGIRPAEFKWKGVYQGKDGLEFDYVPRKQNS